MPELVALRVAAEVIVVVQHQDARVGTDLLAIEERGRQTADAAADYNQVIDGVAGILRHP